MPGERLRFSGIVLAMGIAAACGTRSELDVPLPSRGGSGPASSSSSSSSSSGVGGSEGGSGGSHPYAGPPCDTLVVDGASREFDMADPIANAYARSRPWLSQLGDGQVGLVFALYQPAQLVSQGVLAFDGWGSWSAGPLGLANPGGSSIDEQDEFVVADSSPDGRVPTLVRADPGSGPVDMMLWFLQPGSNTHTGVQMGPPKGTRPLFVAHEADRMLVGYEIDEPTGTRMLIGEPYLDHAEFKTLVEPSCRFERQKGAALGDGANGWVVAYLRAEKETCPVTDEDRLVVGYLDHGGKLEVEDPVASSFDELGVFARPGGHWIAARELATGTVQIKPAWRGSTDPAMSQTGLVVPFGSRLGHSAWGDAVLFGWVDTKIPTNPKLVVHGWSDDGATAELIVPLPDTPLPSKLDFDMIASSDGRQVLVAYGVDPSNGPSRIKVMRLACAD